MMDIRKRLKYGSYAVVVTVIVIAIFILINLIISNQDWKIDLTMNKLHSLSDQTKQILSNIKQDVNVYVFYLKGMEDRRVQLFLENYKKYNTHIKVEYLDVYRNPHKARKYADIFINENNPVAIVFETPKRSKVVNYYELYESDERGNPVFIGEQKFTNGIKYVTLEKVPTIYLLQGHKEPALNRMIGLSELLRIENYTIQPLNLLKEKKIPQDADLIIDISPQTAFFPEEIKLLEDYFANGGKGIFFIDPAGKEKQDISSLKAMFSKWGININDDLVVEGSPKFYYIDNVTLLPEIQSHEITNPIIDKGLNIVIRFARSFKLLNQTLNKSNEYVTHPILKSSSNSWGKVKLDKTLEKEHGDLPGPLNIGVVITKNLDDKNKKEMKVVVFGSSSLIDDKFLQNSGNSDLFLNTVGWLIGTPEEITIRPKDVLYKPLTINREQLLITVAIVLIIMPAVVLVTGLIVWARRRQL